ncbi:HD-GYP domain-containing protein (c-di-GMP phosphodiesterase class II) [Peribacillus cavernae]|nr:HD-GYP domain-containing protein [Peribacillus cavernae]MDQ0220928.1 HD-GYP domain-containing protein (c-di-GMP phosphodiesterase class II) [Peribacillus cavernae]
MRVKTDDLVEGTILAKDIPGLANRPIMASKTIINHDRLEVLKAFLIAEVSVEKTLINGLPFVPKEMIEDEEEEKEADDSHFISAYLRTVQSYKKLFRNWQAGSSIEVSKVRELIIPLFNKVMQNQSQLFLLHHYSTKADYLFHHAISVGLISGYLAKNLNYEQGDMFQIVMAGCLVDCGMAKVPPTILEKKTSLSSEEFEEVKRHPIYSLQMLQNSPLLKEAVKYAILQHHERLDGSGYPSGRRGQSPHAFSRIVAVADVYHAMTSERNYRIKQSPFKVMEMILQDDFGKFDISAVKTLLSGITNFSIGSKVKLSNGYTAEIIFIESNGPTRPMVKLLDTGEIIHLGKNREIFIEEAL